MSEEPLPPAPPEPSVEEWALIVNMRIYDVLMGIYTHLDATAAEQLAEAHHKGVLLCSPPNFTGEFIAETINTSE